MAIASARACALFRELAGLLACCCIATTAYAQPAPTDIGAWAHTPQSTQAMLREASISLPSSVTGGEVFVGKFKDKPAGVPGRVPVVLVMHPSVGIGASLVEWQRWVATLGFATFAPDSFALPGRIDMRRATATAHFEQVNALRASEIEPALGFILAQPWADPARLILAGSSEGAIAVARYDGSAFAARMIFSWTCEDNYAVDRARNSFKDGRPVFNAVGAADPLFSRANPNLGNPAATGNCAAALQGRAIARVLVVPEAAHIVMYLPATMKATREFLANWK